MFFPGSHRPTENSEIQEGLNGDNVKNLIIQKPVSVLTSFDIFVSQEANIIFENLLSEFWQFYPIQY